MRGHINNGERQTFAYVNYILYIDCKRDRDEFYLYYPKEKNIYVRIFPRLSSSSTKSLKKIDLSPWYIKNTYILISHFSIWIERD